MINHFFLDISLANDPELGISCLCLQGWKMTSHQAAVSYRPLIIFSSSGVHLCI